MTESEWLVSQDPMEMLNRMRRYPAGDKSGGWEFHPHMPSDRKLQLWVDASDSLCLCSPSLERRHWTPMHWAAMNDAHQCLCTRNARAALLREIVGNPFHPVNMDICVRECCGRIWSADESQCCRVCGDLGGARMEQAPWLTLTVLAIAQRIYDERAFDRLSILADAFEDAGCSDRTILDHLRGPGPHVLGCWALDLVLGKE